MAIKKLKNNSGFKSPKHITDQQIEFVNDDAYWKEHNVKSKDELKLLLSQSKGSRIYYKCKIFLHDNYLFQKGSKICINIHKIKIG